MVTKLGIATSPDGITWTEGSNPISSTEGEDPYIVKDVHGNVWRDSSGLAYLYAEEKSGSTHRGINLFRSDANLLTGWTFHSRVIDKAASGWDSQDRTSPIVIHDGTKFVMLFGGRSASQNGQIGYATSADGITWTVEPSPIITQGSAGTWNADSIGCGDVIKIGDRWVLLTQGNDGTNWGTGRYETTDDPADWDSSSFTEMAGNPIETFDTAGGEKTATITCWGNDPRYVVRVNTDGTAMEKYRVTAR